MIRRARLDTDPDKLGCGSKRYDIARNECSTCNALNPTALGSPPPTHCAVCGSRIQSLKENANGKRAYDKAWRSRRNKFKIG